MLRRSLLLVAGCGLVALSVDARAADPDYLDDRSSPEALVNSLYNAINRKEYARAYSYFGTPPAKTVEAYAEGYAQTESVEVAAGPARAEGAAGSIIYSLPVAIRATTAGGEEQVYAGCYMFRFIQPAVQETPYRPLFIEGGKLTPAEPASGSWKDALPPTCGEGEPVPSDPLLQKAERLFHAVYGDICTADETGSEEEEPEMHVIRFNYDHDSADTPASQAHLFRFFCDRGAYNEVHAYIFANERGEMMPLAFATPELHIEYENGDSDGRVEEVRIVGYTTENLLINSWFDPNDRTISSHGKWRGVGDASSGGMWAFRSGAFSLVRYEVDASYDGENNPETVLDYSSGP
ncbi:DUF1176 domain-containing protein [Chelativorans sp.]|uniref:DUF1176 domain-containing protein n=1 Tax=Chelativorans sp. TaxID=2203393 RepID=UPI0028122AAE|nr:DUF1176 domain-containing protein [Chelativorans sp.]